MNTEKNGWTICWQWRAWSDHALFANYPFGGLQTEIGLILMPLQITDMGPVHTVTYNHKHSDGSVVIWSQTEAPALCNSLIQ